MTNLIKMKAALKFCTEKQMVLLLDDPEGGHMTRETDVIRTDKEEIAIVTLEEATEEATEEAMEEAMEEATEEATKVGVLQNCTAFTKEG